MNWIPDVVLDEISDDVELVEDLESFDARIVKRGWSFDDDQSDEEFVIWFYPPSGAPVGDGLEPVTTIWMHVAENAEFVHVIPHLEAIEVYRAGDPALVLD